MNRTKLEKLLVDDEGRKTHLYQDTRKVWTIGIGYNIQARGLPDDIIDMLFDRTVTEAMRECVDNVPGFRTLDDTRQHVLISMVFQMGLAGVLKFHKMLVALERRDFDTAADEMLDSDWARVQTPARARKLAQMMRDGK